MPEIFEELFHACKLILRNKNKPTVADRSFFDPVDRQSEGTVAGGQQESSDHAVHRFQERLDVLSESQKALEKDVKKQKQLVKDLQTRNQSLQEQKRTESAALHSNIEALRSKIEVLRSKIEVTEGQLRASREEGFTWENQAKKVYSQLQSLQMAYKNTKDLLERRTRELDHALSFLSKADDISHTEVLSMVEHANTLSFHLATCLADITLFSQSLDRPQPSEEASALVEGLLGKDIFELLISEKHSEDPLYFQIALQAMVTAFVAYYVNKWDRGTLLEFPGQHELLRKTHIEIFKTEPQAVSARWRALTRRCYRRIEYSENADPARTASEQLLRAIKQVIEVAGGVLPREEPLDRVEEIIQHCFKIQRTIGEEVISTDFEVIYPDACAPWKPQVMADFDGGGRGQAKKVPDGTHTLCTVELGLQRFEKTADLEGGEEKEGYQNTVLLRAKVLLPIEADDESDATVEAPKSRPVAP